MSTRSKVIEFTLPPGFSIIHTIRVNYLGEAGVHTGRVHSMHLE